MSRVEMCQDGIEMALLNEGGLWFVMHQGGEEFARFATDPCDVRAVLEGKFSLQFSDGAGNGVAVEGGKKGLKIRLEGNGHAPKNCRIALEEVEKISGTLNAGV